MLLLLMLVKWKIQSHHITKALNLLQFLATMDKNMSKQNCCSYLLLLLDTHTNKYSTFAKQMHKSSSNTNITKITADKNVHKTIMLLLLMMVKWKIVTPHNKSLKPATIFTHNRQKHAQTCSTFTKQMP